MKPFILFTCFFLVNLFAYAQPSADQRIEDSVIGWWDNNRFDKLVKPTTDPVKLKRVAVLDKVVEWMKKSYTPVGGIGTSSRENFKVGFMVRFGVWGVSYGADWTDEKGHFKPVAEEIIPFGIAFNNVPASYAIRYFNGNGASYFVWPKDGFRLDGQPRDGSQPAGQKDFHPRQAKYITRSNESQIVMLAPGNKLPFVQLTRREYIDLTEAALIKESSDDLPKALATIAKIRKLYDGKLDLPCETTDMQPSLQSFKNGDTNLFDIRADGYPVYKIPADVMKKAESDQPQWIAFYYPYFPAGSGNRAHEMNKSMMENINYDYIYNYFFDPEKVKGIAYKAADEEGLQARLSSYRNKYRGYVNAKNKSAKSPNVLMDENFASVSDGTKPPGWYIRSTGKPATVVTVDGKPGKWLKMGEGNPVNPIDVAMPLPADFKLDFDLATGSVYTARSGANIVLRFSTEKINSQGDEGLSAGRQWMEFKFVAGLDEAFKSGSNYRGFLKAEMHDPASGNKDNYTEGIFYETPLGQFTDKKSTVHIGLRMKKGVCEIYVDDKLLTSSSQFKMAHGKDCVRCGLAPTTRFNSFRWISYTEDGTDVGAYISNIKMIKE